MPATSANPTTTAKDVSPTNAQSRTLDRFDAYYGNQKPIDPDAPIPGVSFGSQVKSPSSYFDIYFIAQEAKKNAEEAAKLQSKLNAKAKFGESAAALPASIALTNSMSG